MKVNWNEMISDFEKYGHRIEKVEIVICNEKEFYVRYYLLECDEIGYYYEKCRCEIVDISKLYELLEYLERYCNCRCEIKRG